MKKQKKDKVNKYNYDIILWLLFFVEQAEPKTANKKTKQDNS